MKPTSSHPPSRSRGRLCSTAELPAASSTISLWGFRWQTTGKGARFHSSGPVGHAGFWVWKGFGFGVLVRLSRQGNGARWFRVRNMGSDMFRFEFSDSVIFDGVKGIEYSI